MEMAMASISRAQVLEHGLVQTPGMAPYRVDGKEVSGDELFPELEPEARHFKIRS
jgi:hypothetical protein